MRSLPICPEIYFRNSEALVGSWFYFQDSPRRSDRGDVLSGGRAGPKRPRKSPSKALGRLERNRRAPGIGRFTLRFGIEDVEAWCRASQYPPSDPSMAGDNNQ